MYVTQSHACVFKLACNELTVLVTCALAVTKNEVALLPPPHSVYHKFSALANRHKAATSGGKIIGLYVKNTLWNCLNLILLIGQLFVVFWNRF